MKDKLKKSLLKLLNFFPSKLPSGSKQFEQFAYSLISTYNLPNNDSFRWIIAQLIMSMDNSKEYQLLKMIFGNAYRSKRRIYLEIRGAEARQTAAEMFRLIKENQQKEQAKQAAVVTTAPALAVVTTNEPIKKA